MQFCASLSVMLLFCLSVIYTVNYVILVFWTICSGWQRCCCIQSPHYFDMQKVNKKFDCQSKHNLTEEAERNMWNVLENLQRLMHRLANWPSIYRLYVLIAYLFSRVLMIPAMNLDWCTPIVMTMPLVLTMEQFNGSMQHTSLVIVHGRVKDPSKQTDFAV